MHETIDINFKMKIENNGESHLIEFHDRGKRFFKNNKMYLKLKEPLMDSNKFNNLMFICDTKEIVIIRSGFVNMKQNYIEKEFTRGLYKNDYITSEIVTYTKKYEYSKDNINLNYEIVLDSDIIGNYKMELLIKGVDRDE